MMKTSIVEIQHRFSYGTSDWEVGPAYLSRETDDDDLTDEVNIWGKDEYMWSEHYRGTDCRRVEINLPDMPVSMYIDDFMEKANQWCNNNLPENWVLFDWGREYYNSKFAELIVRECASICEDHPAPPDAGMLGNEIKEHFGVESKPIIPIEIEPHTCPYKTELYGDETLCTCSPEQEHECAMDV